MPSLNLNRTIWLLTGCVMPESKYHIRAPLKKADIPLPAHTAFAVLQADELLLHATPASGTMLESLAIADREAKLSSESDL